MLRTLRGEDRTEFREFSDNLRGDLKPVGQLESLLAERIASFFWRLKRTSRMEKGLLDIISSSPQNAASPAPGQKIPYEIIITKAYGEPETDLEYQEYLKSKGRLTPNEKMLPSPVDPAAQSSPPSAVSESKPAVSEGVVLSEEQLSGNLGRLVQQDFKGSKLLEKLLRYEGQIERSLYRAMLELQKLQSNRAHSEAIEAEEVAPDEIVVEDLPAVGWALAHAEAEKPNKPISEEIPPPQASLPIENRNLKMENPSLSSPHFQGGLPRSGEGVLPLAGSCSPEKPNKPILADSPSGPQSSISEKLSPPQALPPMENGKWQMENSKSPIIHQQSTESSPHFQGGAPRSGEGVLPLAGSWPLVAGSCSPEIPNKPISEEISPPQALPPIENGKWQMENSQSPIVNQQSLISPSGTGYKPSARYSPPKRISPHDTWLSRLSDEELARLAEEMEYQSNPVQPKPAIVNDFSHLTDEELDRLAEQLRC